jgi:hypothetical protein
MAQTLGQTGDPDWLAPGLDYFGHGMQDSGSGWTIRILVDGPDRIRIRYPSIPCAGTLERLESLPDQFAFAETITENPQTCAQGGTVTLEPLLPGALRYRWHDGTEGAEGTLVLLPATKTS